MKDKLNECLSELFSLLQGNLIVGDHDSLSIFGSIEQQKLGELSREITRLLLKQGYDIEVTIDSILNELKQFEALQQKKSWNPFVTKVIQPHSVLLGHYNSTLHFIETLQVELKLQEARILKETVLLENLESRLEQSNNELQLCLDKGIKTLNSLENEKSCSENLSQWKTRLIQKINDLNVSYIVSMQTLSQVKMLQENNEHLIERIRAITLRAIPIWHEQMKVLIAIENYSKGNGINKEFSSELEILSKMESLDIKIRNELKDISI